MGFVEVDLEFLLVVGEQLHALAEELDLLAVFDLETHLYSNSANISNRAGFWGFGVLIIKYYLSKHLELLWK